MTRPFAPPRPACPSPLGLGRWSILALTLALSACATFPDVPQPTGDAGTYPELAPIDDLVAQAEFGPPPP